METSAKIFSVVSYVAGLIKLVPVHHTRAVATMKIFDSLELRCSISMFDVLFDKLM